MTALWAARVENSKYRVKFCTWRLFDLITWHVESVLDRLSKFRPVYRCDAEKLAIRYCKRLSGNFHHTYKSIESRFGYGRFSNGGWEISSWDMERAIMNAPDYTSLLSKERTGWQYKNREETKKRLGFSVIDKPRKFLLFDRCYSCNATYTTRFRREYEYFKYCSRCKSKLKKIDNELQECKEFNLKLKQARKAMRDENERFEN